MTIPAGPLELALVLLAGAASPKPELPMIDGTDSPKLIEADYVYHCGEDRAEISYRQEKRNPHEVALSEARRVDLARLSVSGRRIAPAGFEKARQVFQSYVVIVSVEVRCFRRSLAVSVTGTPRQEWVAYLERDAPELPQPVTQVIRISREGMVTIRR